MRCISLLFIVLFSFCIAVFSQNPYQETVYLKNGSIIKGIIVEQVPNQTIKIQTADGSIFVYKMEEVEKITKAVANTDSYKSTTTSQSYFKRNYEITGYRGFIDFGYAFGMGDWELSGAELSTSHGCQFTPQLFLGGGAGIHTYMFNGYDKTIIPIFIDFRGNFTKGAIVPFGGIKAGYSYDTESSEDLGVYLSSSVGVKFMVSKRRAFNISLGYTIQYAEIQDRYRNYSTEQFGGLSLKTGVEF